MRGVYPYWAPTHSHTPTQANQKCGGEVHMKTRDTKTETQSNAPSNRDAKECAFCGEWGGETGGEWAWGNGGTIGRNKLIGFEISAKKSENLIFKSKND